MAPLRIAFLVGALLRRRVCRVLRSRVDSLSLLFLALYYGLAASYLREGLLIALEV